MSWHSFVDHETEEECGSFEVFFYEAPGIKEESDNGLSEDGWYWWPCFPGCMPDGEAIGPFETEKQALEDALNV